MHGLLILMHGIISLPDPSSYDKAPYEVLWFMYWLSKYNLKLYIIL